MQVEAKVNSTAPLTSLKPRGHDSSFLNLPTTMGIGRGTLNGKAALQGSEISQSMELDSPLRLRKHTDDHLEMHQFKPE